MHVSSFFAAILFGLITFVDAYYEPALPRSARESVIQRRQVTRAELTARHKYPDLFNKRDDPAPSSSAECDDCIDCTHTEARRSLNLADQVLTPKEMAAFLKGRGSFVSDNGTHYIDEHYIQSLQKADHAKSGYRHRLYNVVKNKIGDMLLEVSVPVYRNWKQSLPHGHFVPVSPITGIRSQDLDELVRILLEDPEFDEIQYHSYHVSRRFLEVATSY